MTRSWAGLFKPHRLFLGCTIWLAILVPLQAQAHEARPAYLEITETSPDRYELLWRTPLLSGLRLPVVLKLPAGVQSIGQLQLRELSDSLVERRLIEADGGLAGKRIEFTGLQATITDILVRVTTHAGGQTVTIVRPSQPWIEIAATAGPMAVTGAFLVHGIEHILLGYDHLLFVFALLLIVRSRRALIATITAFTIAHSITLSLATLGFVHVPGPPVEATIALSILLLACELVRLHRGQPGLTARWPWLIAFSFGLLHGFGFAGVLSEIGLPRSELPLALLMFNMGVEVGQLLFVAVVLALAWCANRVRIPRPDWSRQAPGYVIGTIAAFWLVERIAAF
jgi:hydrogenase/urease accessory protein HupE